MTETTASAVEAIARQIQQEAAEIDSRYLALRDDAALAVAEQDLEAMFGSEARSDPAEGIKEEAPPDPRMGPLYKGFVYAPIRGMTSMVHGFMRGTQRFYDLFDATADLISGATGWDKGGCFRSLAELAEPPADWTPRDLAEKILSGLSGAPVDIATIGGLPGSAPVTMGYMGAIHGSRGGWSASAKEAAQGLLLGHVLHAAGILRPGVRVPAMATIGGATTAAEGGGAEEIAESAAVMGGLGLFGGPGLERNQDLRLQREMKAAAKQDGTTPEMSGAAPAHGLETEILHNQGRDRARYAVAELQDLVPSHLASQGFARNPRYPEKTQERQYDMDQAEQMKVIRNAQTYNPAYTVNTDPTMINGPPAVTREGIVLGGNSRVMSLDEVYRNFPHKAREYRDHLESHASDYGVEPAELARFKEPVLVRVVDSSIQSPADFTRRVRLYNEPPTQAMESTIEGVSRARLMSDESFDMLSAALAEHGPTLRQYLDRPPSRDFIAALAADGVIDRAELNRVVSQKTGLLAAEGKTLVEQVVRGRVFDDADLLSRAPAGIIKKLDMSLPALAKIKARGDEWNLVPDLMTAIEMHSQMKAAGLKSTGEYLAQGEMFDRSLQEPPPQARILFEALEKMKPLELRAALEDFARAAAADVRNQTSFAFYTPETPSQVFDRVFTAAARPDILAAEKQPFYDKPIRLSPTEQKRLEDKRFEGKKKASETDAPQQLVLTGGPPAAGKSSSVKAANVDKSDFILADSDAIKRDAGYEKQAAAFHEQSSRINKSVADRAIDEGYHLLYDSLLTNFPLADSYIKRTLAKDGHVSILFTDIDAETSQVRSLARMHKGESPRAVPGEVSVKGYNRSLPTFLELWNRYKNNDSVDFHLIDNNVDGREPLHVFSKQNGKLRVYDNDLFDKLIQTPYHKIRGGDKYERQEGVSKENLETRAQEIRSRAGGFRGHAEGQQAGRDRLQSPQT